MIKKFQQLTSQTLNIKHNKFDKKMFLVHLLTAQPVPVAVIPIHPLTPQHP